MWCNSLDAVPYDAMQQCVAALPCRLRLRCPREKGKQVLCSAESKRAENGKVRVCIQLLSSSGGAAEEGRHQRRG